MGVVQLTTAHPLPDWGPEEKFAVRDLCIYPTTYESGEYLAEYPRTSDHSNYRRQSQFATWASLTQEGRLVLR